MARPAVAQLEQQRGAVDVTPLQRRRRRARAAAARASADQELAQRGERQTPDALRIVDHLARGGPRSPGTRRSTGKSRASAPTRPPAARRTLVVLARRSR